MGYKDYPFSKSTYYRRKKKAEQLNCDIMTVPDNRGRHSSHVKGSQHYRWNSGRMLTEDGYAKVRVGVKHHLADPNGYAYEHLLIWVSDGRLRPREDKVFHHKNGDKTDNRLENLEVLHRATHNQIHNSGRERNALGQFV